MRKFKRAQAQNQASIEKHLKTNYFESSSEDEADEIIETAVEKVLTKYQNEGGDSNKVISYLTETFQLGGAVCLICISTVKKIDSIWCCNKCFAFMHLTCIQHWIHDSISYKREKGIKPSWGCPKCRTEYLESDIPEKYLCFCGKLENPQNQPWLIPHSCGDICGKFLQPKCGHKCVLLCHPGPCPPCPKMVLVECYCKKQPPATRRCNFKEWSCEEICNKNYKICNHHCEEKCHPGECPPCSKMVLANCNCQSKKEMRKCSDPFWKCDKICNRQFSCNVHTCYEFCHKLGDCNKCPLEMNYTCPCGKKKYAITCKQQQSPTCGDTCGKLLDCGVHYCNMRCHTEKCGQCLEVVSKTCRCNSFTKEVACSKEFHCNKKCPQMKLCGRHLCNKKCCDCVLKNIFKVCEKVCDNNLNCRKHKCTAPCHSGPCYPCPQTVDIKCRCGSNKITVPCGTVKKIKPPHCNKTCKIPPICHHPKRETHKCHQGPCPPCRKICGLIYKRCGHTCITQCHTKVWTKIVPNGVPSQPKGPWEISQREIWDYKTFKCPPCEVSVMITCLGGHETLPWPCHNAYSRSCLRECGQLLPCTNHVCELPCHKLQTSQNSEKNEGNTNCMECEKICVLPRRKGCIHNCNKLCHPSPCEICKQLVKISCHCKINILYIRCHELTSASEEEKKVLLQCGNQCPRNYSCGHRCSDNCHYGPCQNAELCSKKVKIFCKCKRIKKDYSCLLVRNGKAVVKCDEICLKRKEELEKIRSIELEKQKKMKELQNQKELEIFEKKFKPKRRRDKYDSNENSDKKKSNFKWSLIFTLFIFIIVLMVIYTNFII